MSIRTALVKFLSPKNMELVPRDAERVAIPPEVKLHFPALGSEQLRGLLLQLLPDPLAGREGPVQILSPFESERQVRAELAGTTQALTNALTQVSTLSDDLAAIEGIPGVREILDRKRQAKFNTELEALEAQMPGTKEALEKIREQRKG